MIETGTAIQTRYQIYLYHHTHWDREWWTTLQALRVRLVRLIDELLDALDADSSFYSFMLDGQTIVLRDYLEIRPENRERLLDYLRAGRIQCGPWYILPDEFLVSGEAHLRNLWLGERVAQELGYRNLSIGYLPDTFGHISQMPQILRGFGIDNAFLWRGRGGAPDACKQEFSWQAPDGSRVLAFWFPDGYYQMPMLHFPNPEAPYEKTYGRVRGMIEQWSQRASTDLLLMPYGGDHRLIDPALPRTLGIVQDDVEEIADIRWATLPEFLAALRARDPELQTASGELRDFGPDNPHLLSGVLSARLYLKRLNAEGQTWLERYAEPFAALAWRHGLRYDAGLLWKAWEYLVQNHPHDSICGCSIDQVHREMVPRFDQSRQIAQSVTEQSVQHLNERISTIDDLGADDLALVIHNALPWTRTGHASVWLDRPDVSPRTHALVDETGQEVPFQVKPVEGLRPLCETYRHIEIGFSAAAVHGLGYRTYRLTPREEPRDAKMVYFTAVPPVARLKGSEAVGDLRLGANALENAYLRVEVDPRTGTLSVLDRATGYRYDGLNEFEDGGDAGDTYNYAAPLNDIVLRSSQGARVHVSVAEAGYARATLRVDLDWALPATLSEDRLSRTSEYVETRISTFVSLASQARCVEIATEWDNAAYDHRLRALFPLGLPATVSHAQGQFDVVDRPVPVAEPGAGWDEPYAPTMPQQGWVSVDAQGRGLTIANRGLPEFEILDDGRGTIALTLLRAVGWLSREDTPARVGGAGPEVPVPDAQCAGRNSVSYAIIPHGGDWLSSGAYRVAEEYAVPLYGSVTGAHAGDLPRSSGFAELEGAHTLLLSACKKAERSDALILRCWNVAREETIARVRLRERPASVRLVDLKEEPLANGALDVYEDGTFTLRAGPAQIVTFAVEF